MPITTFPTAMTLPHRVRACWALCAALVLPVVASAGAPTALPGEVASLSRLPPAWRDDHGETLRLQSLQGQPIFVTMAYTSCHRTCPMTMARLTEMQDELDARGASAQFLIVSYDPVNDDSAAWRRYRDTHHLLRGNWHFLSGTSADTETLARVLGFEFWRDGEHVMHDFRIVALNGNGAERGFIDSAHGDWRALL